MAAGLISIIGPPAVGKTTLAENLCQAMAAELIREDFAGNPFLAPSYDGDPQARLPGQLYFLFSRFDQLKLSDWPEQGLRVSDYGYCQDRIYAKVRLSADDYRLYDRLAGRLEGLVRPPDVLIALDAGVNVLLERIARRGRGFEKAMDVPFLEAMRQAYLDLPQQAQCPVVRVDCGRWDLRQLEHLERMRSLLAELMTKDKVRHIVEF